MVHIGSGCTYQGDNDGKGYSEEDIPNWDGNYYAWTKIVSERYLKDSACFATKNSYAISS
jgi:nucleoside-diphosphate-sugar epimerase